MIPIEKVVQFKKELDLLRPLKAEDELRIMQKFRLDWNYHSNHLEGNTLTYGETKALLLFGITAQGKPLQEHLEMSGHDEAIKWIEEVVKEQRPLTENFIRQLHELLLKKPYEVDAITPDGKPTKKKIQIGSYKKTPNHVKTKTGEIFRFASPEETPAMMQNLLCWYNKKRKESDLDPVLFAAEFHYRFIRIHPFDDGNGRMARILMNFILMSFGYPPVIIKTEDKENYFTALRQADAGILSAFIAYICNNLITSLEIMLKGARGESIEETDDIDKELMLLQLKFKEQGIGEKKYKSIETIKNVCQKSLFPLLKRFIEKGKLLEPFFHKTIFFFYSEFYSVDDEDKLLLDFDIFLENIEKETQKVNFFFRFEGFQDEPSILNKIDLIFLFSNSHYEIRNMQQEKLIEKNYFDELSKEEIKELVDREIRKIKSFIEEQLKN